MERYDVCLLIKNHLTAQKLLKTYQNKALISHIIERFAPDVEIVFSMAEGTDLLAQYLKLAHGQRRFIFVRDEGHRGSTDLEKRLISNCEPYLSRQFMLLEDPIWWHSQTRITASENWFAISKLPKSPNRLYQFLNVNGDYKISGIKQKSDVGEEKNAYLGMAFIKQTDEFWQYLDESRTFQDALIKFIENVPTFAHFFAHWQEIEKIAEVNQDRFVIKHKMGSEQINIYLKSSDCQNIIEKHEAFPTLYANIRAYSSHSIKYQIPEGASLHSYIDQQKLEKLLTCLENYLWKDSEQDVEDFPAHCLSYYQKLSGRIYENISSVKYKADKKLFDNTFAELKSRLANVNWDRLAQGTPSPIHGDLYLRKAHFDQFTDTFELVDPAPDFAGLTKAGDKNLDLATIYASLRYDYPITECEDIISFFEEYLEQNGYELAKIKELAALCLLENSSADTISPFYLAKVLLAEAQQEELPALPPMMDLKA